MSGAREANERMHWEAMEHDNERMIKRLQRIVELLEQILERLPADDS